MLPISTFDADSPYVEPLLFAGKEIPGRDGIAVLRDSIMQHLPMHKDPLAFVDEKWNVNLGAYAEELRKYVEEVDKVVGVETALEEVMVKVRTGELELREALHEINGNPEMKARFKTAASAWVHECKRMYEVRYRNEAWVAARVTETEVYAKYMAKVEEFMKPARAYLQEIDTAYASLMRHAMRHASASARARGGVVQDDLRKRMTEAMSTLPSNSSGSSKTDSEDSNKTAASKEQTPRAKVPTGQEEEVISESPSPSKGTKRSRASASSDRRDKPSRTALFLQRNDNRHRYNDPTLSHQERLRACNALLHALPSTITKVIPNAVRECPNMEPDSLRHYIEAVQRAVEANSDLEPVWYHLYFNKLPSDLQTAIHQHFAPVPVPLIPFGDVATHIRQTYISTEVLVTVLQKLRTTITFNPKVKGSADTFALAVRLARDRLRAQFGNDVNDIAMFGYINDWMGQGHWMSREFNKHMLGKPITWENINMALIYCSQHDALYAATSTRESTNPSTDTLKSRTPTERHARYHPYSQTRTDTRKDLPQTMKQLQATVNNLAAHFTTAEPAMSQGSVNPDAAPPSISNIDTHAAPPPTNYTRPWSEKFCSFCKFAQQPASVFTTHNTRECKSKDQPENAEMKTAWASRLAKHHPENPTNPHNKGTRRPGLGSDQ